MYLQYGSYQHQSGECWLTISQTAEETNGLLTGVRVRYDVSGRLQIADQGSPLANQAAMTPVIAALENAYSVNGLDFGMYQDDGTPTAHVLINAETLGGVQVIRPPSYNEGRGAEYSTFRNYQLSVQALLPNLFQGLIAWKEAIHLVGGGAKDVWLETLTGPPLKQTPVEQTTYRATQSGHATGLYGFINPSDPLWPYALHEERAMVTYSSPERFGASGIVVLRNYLTEWHYEFEDADPLLGLPNFWGNSTLFSL